MREILDPITVEPAAERPRGAAAAPVCPHLGLSEDAATHCAFPTVSHRCHRAGRPLAIRTLHQAECCLTAEHESCPVLRAPAGADTGSRANVFVRPPKRRWRAVLVGAALVAAVAVAAGYMGTRGTAAGPDAGSAQGTAAPSPAGRQRYLVRPGDDLRAVTDFFGVHPDDVAALNHLGAERRLQPGTFLTIPVPKPDPR